MAFKAFSPLLALCLLSTSTMAQSNQAEVEGASTSTVVSALILNGVIFAVMITGFFLLRPKFRKIYQPKSYLGPKDERVETQPPGLFNWIPQWWSIPTIEIMHKNGLDAFMFIEYLEMMVFIMVPIFVLSWIVLLPLYSAKSGGTADGFNMFTYGNLGNTHSQQLRAIGTLLVQWVATFWIMWNIRSRTAKFVKLRQEFLISKKHSSTAQAKTILLTGVPNNLLSERKLTSMYSQMPGGVAKVWINRNLGDLPDMVDERNKWLNKLEGAEASIVKLAYKKVKKGKVQESGSQEDPEMNVDVAERYVEKKERPTHKLGAMGCYGEKVDTLEWCRERISELNRLIEEKRKEVDGDYQNYPPQNSAFVLFNTQIAAHMAVKSHAHHAPYTMADNYVEAHPLDVVWQNLGMNPYEKKIRTFVFWAATIALIVFWSIPIGFIGIVSNVKGLTDKAKFLDFLNHIGVVTGIIQGLLPTVLLAVVNMLLPIVLRLFARLSGVPTYTGIELSLATRFFLFQIVQNFFVLTIISGGSSEVGNFARSIASDPTSLPEIIAKAIPKASIFFLSYIALAGLTGAASGFLQIVPLIVYYVKLFLLGSSPRKVWHITNDMPAVSWGTLLPVTALVSTIAMGYLVIAPIVNGFTMVTFILYYVLYRYLFTYVYDMKPQNETSGLFFPKVITWLLAGLYLEMVMMAALFFVAQDDQGNQSAIPEGAFMIVLIVIVAAFHYVLSNSYSPLYTALPLSIVPPNTSQIESSETHLNGNGFSNGSVGSPDEKKGLMVESEKNGESQGANVNHDDPHHQDEEDPMKAFVPPAMKDEQRTLWLPNDRFGIGSSHTTLARKMGLDATNEHTSYNEKDKVTTDAYVAPGEVLL